MVDEIGRKLVPAEIFGDETVAADGESGGGIAELQFLRARGLGPALVGGDEQRVAGCRAAQGIQQAGGARALRRGEIHGDDGFAEIQRRGENAGVLPVVERQRGRCESHRGNRRAAPSSSLAGVRQSRAASTPMVRLSSSQLQIARSPRAKPLIAGLNQALASAIALRLSRSRGT